MYQRSWSTAVKVFVAALTLAGLCLGISPACAQAPVSGSTAMGSAEPREAGVRIGQVALAVGQAFRVGAQGQRFALNVGDPLHELDRVVTGRDALLMVVFVDQARMSLRADTEVLIRRYRIDPSGVETQLDVELIRGTVRQISGEAARRQPDRYRLNTPIATIGVRGTDFLARASESKVETYIHEGMIVVLPPVEHCRADCAVLASSSAGDAGRYLQIFRGGMVERSYVPPEDVERLFGIRLATARDRDGLASRPTGASAPVAAAAVAASPAIMPLIFADPQSERSRLSDVRAPSAPGAALSSPATIAQGPYNTPGSAYIAQGLALAPMPSTLVWGRFSEPAQIPVSMVLAYDDARQNRHVTVGELSQYALWRNDPRGTLMPALRGQASFTLSAAEAFLRTPTGSEAALISAARLTADFDLSRFSTELSLSTPSGVFALLSASGVINDEGIFLSLAPDGSQRVAGSFSRSGTEAGYLFNKVVGGGVFQGITLWGIRR